MTIAFRASNTGTASAATSLVLTKPSGTVDGDFVVIVAVTDGGITNVPATLSGWTQKILPIFATSSYFGKIQVHKASSDASTYTVTCATACNWLGIVLTYSGVDFDRTTGVGVDQTSATTNTIGATSYVVAGMTASQDNEMFLSLIGCKMAGTQAFTPFTPASGFTERANIGNGGTVAVLEVSDKIFAASGATGNQSTGFASTSNEGFSDGMLLWPAIIPTGQVATAAVGTVTVILPPVSKRKILGARTAVVRGVLRQRRYFKSILRKPKGHPTVNPPVRRPTLKLYADTRSVLRPKLPTTKVQLRPPLGRLSTAVFPTGVFATGVVGIVGTPENVTWPPSVLYRIQTPIAAVGVLKFLVDSAPTAASVVATGVVGTATPVSGYGVTGLSATATLGTVSVRTDMAVPVGGVQALGRLGSIGIGSTAVQAGVQATGVLGTPAVTVGSGPLASAVSATGVLGTPSIRVDSIAAVSGVYATGLVGVVSEVASITVTVNGVAATGVLGALSYRNLYNVSGVQATAQLGAARVGLGAEVNGLQVRGSVGTVSVSAGCTVAVTGVAALGIVGATAAYGAASVDTLNRLYTRAP